MSPASKAPKAARPKQRRKKTLPPNMALSITNHDLVFQAGREQGRINQDPTSMAVEYGRVRSERTLVSNIRSLMAQQKSKTKKPQVAVAVPTQLFRFHLGPMVKPAAKIDPEQVITNNLESLYVLESGEYGQFVYHEEGEQFRILYVTADRAAIQGYVMATIASGMQVSSIEPRMTAEVRALNERIGGTFWSVFIEEGASYLVLCHNNQIASVQSLEAGESMLMQLGAGQGMEAGLQALIEGQISPMITEFGLSLDQALSNDESYLQSLGVNDYPHAVYLLGRINVPGAAAALHEATNLDFEEVDEPFPLATEGGMKLSGDFSPNMLLTEMIPGSEKRAQAQMYLLPALIMTVWGGHYAYAQSRISSGQARADQAQAEIAALKPKVDEQIRLKARNDFIENELVRATQIREAKSRWPQYIELIRTTVPNPQDIGIINLKARKSGDIQSREFDGRRVNTVFEVQVQARSVAAMTTFIKAFSEAPFAISVKSYQPNPAGGQLLDAQIGASSNELDDRIKSAQDKAAPPSASLGAPLVPAAPLQTGSQP